jgi:hypothetical protein
MDQSHSVSEPSALVEREGVKKEEETASNVDTIAALEETEKFDWDTLSTYLPLTLRYNQPHATVTLPSITAFYPHTHTLSLTLPLSHVSHITYNISLLYDTQCVLDIHRDCILRCA